MKPRKTSLLIGFGMLAVVAVAFSSVFWLQKRHRIETSMPLRIIFEGSISGLRAGRDVTFNGVKVGDVRSVRLDNPQRIVALVMVNNSTPLRKDTLVSIESQGLTGLAAVALKGGAEDAPAVDRDADGMPLLNVDTRNIKDVSQSMKATMQTINKLMDDNQDTVKNSIANIEVFRAVLAKNTDRLDRIYASGDRMTDIMNNSHLTATWNRIPFDKLSGEVSEATREFKELGSNFEKRVAAFNADKQVMQADIARAAANLDRNPARLIFGPSGNQAASPNSAEPGAQQRRSR